MDRPQRRAGQGVAEHHRRQAGARGRRRVERRQGQEAVPRALTSLELAHGLAFADLYRREGLVRLDALFLESLAAGNAALHARLLDARADPSALAAKEESELILEVAPHLDDFIAELFGIAAEFAALSARHHELAPLYSVKRQF